MVSPQLLYLPKMRSKHRIKHQIIKLTKLKKIHLIATDKSTGERLPVERWWCGQWRNQRWRLGRGHARSQGRDPRYRRRPETRVGLQTHAGSGRPTPAYISTPGVMETWDLRSLIIVELLFFFFEIFVVLVDAWLWTIDTKQGLFASEARCSGSSAKLRPHLVSG